MITLRPALRDAVFIALSATVLGFTYTGLTGKGMFGPAHPDRTVISLPPGQAPAAISLAEAKSLFESDSALFIDTRHPFDFRLGHIRGAINEPLTEFNSEISALRRLPDNKVLIAYCDGADCNSSIEFAARLSSLGFRRVRIFFGGWEEWTSHGLPVEGAKP